MAKKPTIIGYNVLVRDSFGLWMQTIRVNQPNKKKVQVSIIWLLEGTIINGCAFENCKIDYISIYEL